MRREITRRGGQKPCLRIVRGLFAALADPAGVIAHRRGALERVAAAAGGLGSSTRTGSPRPSAG